MGPSETIEAKRPARKLAAILAADVVGYSRLMGVDEEGTLARVRDELANVVRPSVEGHRGRIFKTTGDGFLAEFASAVDALACASAIQRSAAAAEAGRPGDGAVRYRIGINVGEVVVEDGDVFGNGVNIAARLEQLAEPGGICLSEDAYRQLHAKSEIRVEDLGRTRLRNIATPVRAYHVRPAAWAGRSSARTKPGRRRHLIAAAGIAALAGVLLWAVGAFHTPEFGPITPLRAAIAEVFGGSPKSIVVEPFANLGGDPAQGRLAAGLTEDLTTALARSSPLRVVAYRVPQPAGGEHPSAKQIARGHGVRYVLEGSIQKDGDKVRINAQVIDGRSGTVVWAHRFDREEGDELAVQGEVTTLIAQALNRRLLETSAGGRAPIVAH